MLRKFLASRGWSVGTTLALGACASLAPAPPEVFYRAQMAGAPDSVCAELATGLVEQVGLARDSSYEVPLGGSRCHEILYAADGNEVWIELRGDELTLAVRFYPQPGDLEKPAPNTDALAGTAVELVRQRYPQASIQRARESAP
jgi:hypothetical protein